MGDTRLQPKIAHTPTPWRFDELAGSKPDGLGYIRCETDNLEISHHGDMGRPRDENLANAAFIVEAVNSHASLKASIEDLEGALDRVMQRANEGLGDISSLQETIHAMHRIACETRGRAVP